MKSWPMLFFGVCFLGNVSFVHAADEVGKTPNGIRYHGGDEIVLQGFHWNSVRAQSGQWYTLLKDNAARIAADGFTSVWMPPPWRDTSQWSNQAAGTSGGGEGYFWHDFDKNGGYGSDAQLHAAAAAFAAAGVKPIYDIVPNHHRQDAQGSLLTIPKGENRLRSDCPNCDDGDPFMAGDADLNLANASNLAMFRDELRTLHDSYDAGGFRFDFVRGYAGKHVDDWMTADDDTGFCVGEYWKGPSEFPEGDPRRAKSWQELLKAWSDEAHCTVFDFALKERMQGGSVADWRFGLNGNPDPRWREVAVTFVDNHDTGPSPGANGGQHHWPLRPELRLKAYAYILTMPGSPTVYWPDMYGDTATSLHDYLRDLIRLRRDAGVHAQSTVAFETKYGGLVANVTGERQRLVVALDSTLLEPRDLVDESFVPALEADGGKVRIWHGGTVSQLPVTFRCDNGTTTPGQSVYVVGSSKELGQWDPARAVLLKPSPYPTWTGSIDVSPAFAVEWKCVVRNETTGAVSAWEPGDNNRMVPAAGAVTTGSF